MKQGDRVFLSGGYDMDPEWLCGRRGHPGVIDFFIPGQNKQPAAVVRLDDAIEVEGMIGSHVVMELRYVDATWDGAEAIAHAELCDFIPESKPWRERKRGKWVESHATIRLE